MARPMVHRITLFNATDRRKYERELLLARQKAEQVTAGDLKRLNETLEERVAHEVAERLKAEEALRQAQKMEAIGQLTGGIAHDFNNLLTIIVGTRADARRRPEEPPPQAGAENAMEATRRAAKLTSCSAFSRLQPLDPRPVAVNKLVAGMPSLLRHTLGEGVRLETLLAGGLGALRRPQPARERDPQPRGQRPRRHAGGRKAHHRDREYPSDEA